ncbi:MAG: hypothetical protein NT027_18990 [Proteobacteria bacterium]|nr:hypothetical protein [Pseudomonadota bacterium]
MDWVNTWFMAFLPIILAKVLFVRFKLKIKAKDSMFFTEAIGLPFTFMQPVVFWKSLVAMDWIGLECC